MNWRSARWLLVVITMLATVLACSPPSPQPAPTPSKPPIDYAALEMAMERAIATGPATLDNIRAVLINVDDETKIAHYRHGFTGDDHEHVWSVTKSVLSTLIGIAIADGLIADLDQPLSALLPEHRKAMSRDVAKVTLRQLMSMTAGFTNADPSRATWENVIAEHGDFVDLLLERGLLLKPGQNFLYSDASAHLVAAVLAAALERVDGDQPRTVLEYARANCSTRWASAPSPPSLTLSSIHPGARSPRPDSLGAPTPTGSRLAVMVCGLARRTWSSSASSTGTTVCGRAYKSCQPSGSGRPPRRRRSLPSTACCGGAPASRRNRGTPHRGGAGNASSC